MAICQRFEVIAQVFCCTPGKGIRCIHIAVQEVMYALDVRVDHQALPAVGLQGAGEPGQTGGRFTWPRQGWVDEYDVHGGF